MFNPFRFPQVLHTLSILIPIVTAILTIYAGDYDLTDLAIAQIPSISLVLGRSSSRFLSIGAVTTAVCVFLAALLFFREAGKRRRSTLVTCLRCAMLFAGYVCMTGLIGFVYFHDYYDQDLPAGLEICFFVSATFFLLLSDAILRALRKSKRVFLWAYDAILVFLVLSFIGLRVLTMIVTLEEAMSLASVLEYALYAVVFLKVAILGWEIYGGVALKRD
jgi:hypothetical protein